ncbi:hypothetical protein BDN71DRAFT_1591924 [Pleurotus eryngii]|uniref:Yeast cell wall synthesis Kre9/Knh1-like N-terminal domain-containing protein n=1 Tax=Pleurotus eryngii TaxID=5323 RepID=A0A9P5ZR95_PLEER|nr:hypothetical protein BDN71DRAFT_1591924 [Pleurotus eryngii]
MKSPFILRLPTTLLVLLSVGGFLLTSISGTPLNPHSHPQIHSHPRSNPFSKSSLGSVTLARRDSEIVYNPPVTYPTKGTTITAGRPFTVTWNTKGVPDEKKSSAVNVVLGHGRGKNEHLDNAHPLAEKIPIMEGKIHAVIPQDTPSRGDYFVVVMGDSANKSPTFTVVNHR